MPVFRTNTPQSIIKNHYSQRGPTGPARETAKYTTVLKITVDSPAGTSFFTNSSGTNYIKSGDDGDLRITGTDFLNDQIVQFYLNGANLIKSEHISRTGQYSFNFWFGTSKDDWIKIIS